MSISGGDYVKIANVYELRGIDQTNPIEATGGSSGGDCMGDDPSDTITTTSANAFIVSAVASFGLNLGSPNGNPQAAVEAYTNQAGSLGFKSGYLLNSAAGRAHRWLGHDELQPIGSGAGGVQASALSESAQVQALGAQHRFETRRIDVSLVVASSPSKAARRGRRSAHQHEVGAGRRNRFEARRGAFIEWSRGQVGVGR